MRIIDTQDVETIRPLYAEWMKIANGAEFGLDIDIEYAEANLQAVLKVGGSLLVAYDDTNSPVGFFAVSPMPSFFGKQMTAMELMWFCLPNAHRAGPALLKAAKKWAVEHNCSHLMLAGSRLASDMHDAVCHFCEKVGAKHFETIYLLEID